MGFAEDLEAAKTSPAPTDDVDVQLNGKTYTLRFRKVSGPEWADAVDHSPARLGVAMDSFYGYNLRAAVLYIAPRSGVLLEDDNEVPLLVDLSDPKKPVNQWDDLLTALGGYDFQRVTDTVYSLNEKSPAEVLDAAKKALGGSGKSSS
ncbi:hypothetical protein [Curtobacterium sp. MCBD17_003]|uniref:hypothetical protein n=1 Tax=Curtobacterium sp. MCBD17_003 TaxID=2175667 RepID=UPI000DA7FE9F|nr:hypothetical protein [Curtobacterium sp. MCBD17_003]WIE54229.1 hypothetical protein DEI88_014060 [Curtobacterium sp. MCBD17_003]